MQSSPNYTNCKETTQGYPKQSLKTSCSTKRFSKQFLATSCHFKHPPAKVVKGQTQKGHRPPLSSNPKHSKNENSLKKQALGEPYTVHVRCTLLFTIARNMHRFGAAQITALLLELPDRAYFQTSSDDHLHLLILKQDGVKSFV